MPDEVIANQTNQTNQPKYEPPYSIYWGYSHHLKQHGRPIPYSLLILDLSSETDGSVLVMQWMGLN